MKTTTQIYNQYHRIWHKQCERNIAMAKKLHPETSGNMLCVYNWGNDAIRTYLACQGRKQARVSKAYNKLYALAEHATHNESFRPLWCEYCKSSTREQTAKSVPGYQR